VGGRGDSCYFPRDLGRGSYGGDVHCFQQYLSARGYLLEEPTGFFGERTAAAAKRWQKDSGLGYIDGDLETTSRSFFATQNGLPAPGSGRVTMKAQAHEKNTCIDVCAEFTGIQHCQTRCVNDLADKKHACREACQVGFGTACDRAFPASDEGGSANFKICLGYMETSCEDTCKKFRD